MENIETNNRIKKELVKSLYEILPPSCFDACIEADVRKGWHSLVFSLCQKMKSLCEENGLQGENIKIIQIKEKFGGLRFYFDIDGASEGLLEDMALLALSFEERSFKVCELCSSENEVNTGKNDGEFHIQTLCSKCRKEKEGLK